MQNTAAPAWKNRFEIRRGKSGTGLGLFAKKLIKKKEFILEYTGTKIPTARADTLKTKYLFEIDKHWTIDGATRSNIARYINHSCDPNCECEIDEEDRIMIHAIKPIASGEELSFDYGDEYFDEFIKPKGCRCGSPRCRKPALRAAD